MEKQKRNGGAVGSFLSLMLRLAILLSSLSRVNCLSPPKSVEVRVAGENSFKYNN